MSALLWVSLEGNPLSYHPKHRTLSLKHLHPSLSNSKVYSQPHEKHNIKPLFAALCKFEEFLQFVLDHLLLSKSEKMLIAENRVSAICTNQSVSLTNAISVNTYEPSESGSDHRIASLPESLEKSLTKNKKKPSLKEAIIGEVDQESEEFKQLPDVVASSHLGNCTFLKIQ